MSVSVAESTQWQSWECFWCTADISSAPKSTRHTWDQGNGALGSIDVVELRLADGQLLRDELAAAFLVRLRILIERWSSARHNSSAQQHSCNQPPPPQLPTTLQPPTHVWPFSGVPVLPHLALSRSASALTSLYMSVTSVCAGRGGTSTCSRGQIRLRGQRYVR